jgi:PTH1 family peptidyl-tRNA hydrolase
MKYLIVGLGNIGSEYKKTRHNVGFMAVDKLAASKGVTFETKRYADIASFKHKGRAIHLIKPSTYMNLSGKAVRHWLTELKIEIENCLVIVDDLALPLETLRMRKKGSDAGHNGLKNIQELLQTQNYPRLRVGIGDAFSKGKQIDFVLGEFDKNEAAALPLILDKIEEMTLSFCSIGIDRTMSQFNS